MNSVKFRSECSGHFSPSLRRPFASNPNTHRPSGQTLTPPPPPPPLSASEKEFHKYAGYAALALFSARCGLGVVAEVTLQCVERQQLVLSVANFSYLSLDSMVALLRNHVQHTDLLLVKMEWGN
ncbi:hypothetical protein YC2023_040963 [Brassica napus]